MGDPPTIPHLDVIRRSYNRMLDVRAVDKWHQHTQNQIEQFVADVWKEVVEGKALLLNAGSGGNSMGIDNSVQIHVDIAEQRLTGVRTGIAADIQRLPFRELTFDGIICVGCVINYCDAARALTELARVLKPGGWLVLEFERSRTLEFAFTQAFSKSATLINTFYNSTVQSLWVYSDKHISSLLHANGISVRNQRYFHLISPLILRMSRSISAGAHAARLDDYLVRLGPVARLACNTIWFCSKRTEF